MPRVVLFPDDLPVHAEVGVNRTLEFRCLDDGDVYAARRPGTSPGGVPGRIDCVSTFGCAPTEGLDDFRVRVVVRRRSRKRSVRRQKQAAIRDVKAFVRENKHWRKAEVILIPGYDELFSRSRGIIETSVLAGMKVLVIGLGSGGIAVTVSLAESGVTDYWLMDGDRIGLGNVSRHDAGIGDVGRKKTAYAAQRIREKNPYARVETWDAMVSGDNKETLRKVVAQSDLVICATDNRESRLMINTLCVENGVPVIIGGAFRRAYGGQVLVVRPHSGPCYQCFVGLLPEQAEDQEIASEEAAERAAYADRPVAVEPGLFNDVKSIAQMVVKLAIQILLQGRATTLASLDEDLVAPWYIWLNRRDAASPYADLEPLGFGVEGFRILRWYGIDLGRDPECPVCGDFLRRGYERLGLEPDPAAAQSFAAGDGNDGEAAREGMP